MDWNCVTRLFDILNHSIWLQCAQIRRVSQRIYIDQLKWNNPINWCLLTFWIDSISCTKKAKRFDYHLKKLESNDLQQPYDFRNVFRSLILDRSSFFVSFTVTLWNTSLTQTINCAFNTLYLKYLKMHLISWFIGGFFFFVSLFLSFFMFSFISHTNSQLNDTCKNSRIIWEISTYTEIHTQLTKKKIYNKAPSVTFEFNVKCRKIPFSRQKNWCSNKNRLRKKNIASMVSSQIVYGKQKSIYLC